MANCKYSEVGGWCGVIRGICEGCEKCGYFNDARNREIVKNLLKVRESTKLLYPFITPKAVCDAFKQYDNFVLDPEKDGSGSL